MRILPKDPVARARYIAECKAREQLETPSSSDHASNSPKVAEAAAVKPVSAISAPRKRAHHVVDRTTSNWVDGDYVVGKGRPPKSAQWKPNQSGNPRGPKPKEKLTPQQAFDKELLAEFPVTLNGEESMTTTGSLLIKLLRSGAVKGKHNSQRLLLDQFLAAASRVSEEHGDEPVDDWEKEVIDEWLKQQELPAQPVYRKPRSSDEEGA